MKKLIKKILQEEGEFDWIDFTASNVVDARLKFGQHYLVNKNEMQDPYDLLIRVDDLVEEPVSPYTTEKNSIIFSSYNYHRVKIWDQNRTALSWANKLIKDGYWIPISREEAEDLFDVHFLDPHWKPDLKESKNNLVEISFSSLQVGMYLIVTGRDFQFNTVSWQRKTGKVIFYNPEYNSYTIAFDNWLGGHMGDEEIPNRKDLCGEHKCWSFYHNMNDENDTNLGEVQFYTLDTESIFNSLNESEEEGEFDWVDTTVPTVIVTQPGKYYSSHLEAMAALDVTGAAEFYTKVGDHWTKAVSGAMDDYLRAHLPVLAEPHRGDICYLDDRPFRNGVDGQLIYRLIRVADHKEFIIGEGGFRPNK